jgi:hypothetical protein
LVAYRWPNCLLAVSKTCDTHFMQPLHISCYHPDSTVTHPFVFYILAKGENPGKPGFNPWTKSFQCIAPNKEMFDFYFWLCFGLFEAGKFISYHRGSVIQFVNLRDLREVLKQFAPHVYHHYQQYLQIVDDLSKLEKRNVTMAEQIVSTKHLQQHLINEVIVKKPNCS